VVVVGQTTSGINFSLAAGGRIEGTVKSSTGVPLGTDYQHSVYTYVQIYSSNGSYVTTGYTNDAGQYLTTGGLPSGTYFARATSTGYVGALYDNILCVNCSATTGTPITVTAGSTTSRIDFSMLIGGRVTGRVRDSATLAGIEGVTVTVYDSVTGQYGGQAVTTANGTYAVVGLPGASYVAQTRNTVGYVDEIYDNIQCSNCSATSGSAFTVVMGGTTAGVDFRLDRGGRITGKVTAAAGGAAIRYVNVAIYDSLNRFVSSTSANQNGDYSSSGLLPGSYFVRTTYNSYGYVNELYDNIICVSCTATTGTAVVIVGTQTKVADFALAQGGSIAGTVTNSGGTPLSGVSVVIYDGNNSSVGSAQTTGSGTYSVGGLPTGTYYAKTTNSLGYINELYNDVVCLTCGVVGGTGIPVTIGQPTNGVNFVLAQGASIAGTITDASNQPIGFMFAQIYTSNGQFVQSVRSDALGRYMTTVGLLPGNYFVRTSNSFGFIDELYNNMTCVGCSILSGTAVAVAGTATTPGIDFSLVAGGFITGTITDESGTPLPYVSVNVVNASGAFVGSGQTNGAGVYKTSGLPGGSYYVRTFSNYATLNSPSYIDQVYRDRECLNCNPTLGTAVAVVLGQETSGIDFRLKVGGRITGIIMTDPSGVPDPSGLSAQAASPIPGVSVIIYTAAGVSVTSGFTDGTGRYFTRTGLPTGSYYARTSNNLGYVDETYDNVKCLGCSVAIGTPIDVVAGATTDLVDFALAAGGRIAGTVVDAATNLPIAGARVEVYSKTGVLLTTAGSGSGGQFITGTGLGTGDYFVRASSQQGYISELYNNIDCAACSPITGTAVHVTAGGTTTGVDFTLGIGGRITGRVTDAATGEPLRGISVSIYNGNNNFVASGSTDANGQYTSGSGLPTGNYFARTNNSQGYVNELYDDTLCLICTPNKGAPIAVTVGQTTTGVNFALAAGARISGLLYETGTSLPIAGATVSIYDLDGRQVTSGFTDNSGSYQTTGGLNNGTYFARTSNQLGYIDKVYDNLLCLACDPTRGTPIVVSSATLVQGINFAMSLGGRVAGTILSTSTGAPIANVRVAVHNVAGSLVGFSFSNNAGQYVSPGLPPGNYRLRTANKLGFVDERYNNFQCAPCPMDTGNTVSIAGALTVGGINFTLDTGGLVSGWVTDALTSAPLAGVTVAFYRSSDSVFVGRSLASDSSGYYAISLPVGVYTAQPDPVEGYVVSLTPALRTAAIGNVTVEVGVETPNVQFPLPACTPPSISPSTLPAATAGVGFSTGLSAKGGAGSYAFGVSGGTLPSGLSMSSGGVISGTPSATGTANFTVAATDATNCATTQSYALFVCGITLGETSANFAAGAGSRTVSVAANSTDCGWGATSNASWISITSGGATGSGTMGYSVAANTDTNPRTGTITVGSQTYTVSQAAGQAVKPAPVGFFDTPAEGASVTGSIAVSGWALDDAGIDRVEIWRDLAAGETTQPFSAANDPRDGKIFIANGTFVKGARPDIAAKYPSYPNFDRAGWGYLLLTQGLWNQGNGTYTLYAFAFDVDGQYTTLGSKTITSNNSLSTKPFGGLDTPTYGAVMSGGFFNFGWALTPNPNANDNRTCTIVNGNVSMSIDSQPLVPVNYGGNRPDIASAFGGFSNGAAAGGAFYIDTTAYGNGDHTIGWYVVDSCGRADGVGSRFFSVLNGANSVVEPAPVGAPALAKASDDSPVLVRQNGNTRGSFTNDQGVHIVRLTQRSRIELELPAAVGALYRGSEIAGGVEKALPIGSSLDGLRGVFYWEPDAAFLGSYDLVFAAGDRAPVRVRVFVDPAK
jgi:5-hydroxyisourate hydrolase-like protein (transthyretin family)